MMGWTRNIDRFASAGRRASRRGAAIVEFALVFILFLLIVLGALEMGRAFWTYATLAHATKQGGHYVQVHGSLNVGTIEALTAEIRRHAVGLVPSALTVTAVWDPDGTPSTNPIDAKRGDIVEVRVKYLFQMAAGAFITGSSTMEMGSVTRMIVAN